MAAIRNKITEFYSIIWMNPKRILFARDEQRTIEDQRVSVTRPSNGDWNLRIAHVRYNDSGEYLCQINTSPVKIKRVYLYVQVPPHILNSESSSDMDVEENDSLELRCKASGVPQPNITWFWRSLLITDGKETRFVSNLVGNPEDRVSYDVKEINNLELRSVPQPSINWFWRSLLITNGKEKLNAEGERLRLPNIQRYQSGMYICLANNGVPQAVDRQIEIKVQYSPVVKLLNTRLGQVVGKETMLECSVTSYPRAKVDWIKNGVKIEHSYKYRLELFPGEYDTVSLTLLIYYVNAHDYGDYTCEARNRMGIDRATMVLYEYRKPTEKPPQTTTIKLTPTETEVEYYYPEEFYSEYNNDRLPPLPERYDTGIEQRRNQRNGYYGESKSDGRMTYQSRVLVLCSVLIVLWLNILMKVVP